jgi:phosphoglycolate phosphatase-like HAD superfamily hydrolase
MQVQGPEIVMNRITPSSFNAMCRRDTEIALPETFSCKCPLRIKAILLDLDGTLMPTYKSLAALQYLEDQLEMPGGWAAAFVADYGFESLLHDPARGRRAAINHARKHGVTVGAATLRRVNVLQEQSFCAYEGLRDLLERGMRAGTFLGIYTNTSCAGAIERLKNALVVPECFDAIWAKSTIEGCGVPCDHANLIPYDYRKPDDVPLRELAAVSGATPREILFIGDSINDLDVVYRDKACPGAIFCLQEKGAADIDERLSAFNARLRPGQVLLGLRSVNSRIDQYGIESDIIRLSDGFLDLLSLIDDGRITLVPPDQTPIVRHNRLVPGGCSPCTTAVTPVAMNNSGVSS